MKRIRDKILEVFFSDTWLGAILWFAAAAAMLALVVWFHVYSGFGEPAMPVYENF